MFNEKQLIQAIALTRLFDIKELVLDSNFVNSEIGKKNLHEYNERVINMAITIVMSNQFHLSKSEISFIVNKVFADVLEIEV